VTVGTGSGSYFVGFHYTVTVTLSSHGGSTNLTYSSIGDDATFTGSGSTQTLTPNASGGPFNFEAIVSNGCAIAIYPYSIASVSKMERLLITAGLFHTCAVTTTGGVDCWGYNYDGELGNNSTASQSNVPVHVVGVGGTGLLSGIADITAGMYHTCAVSTTGGVYCWGNNGAGELGNNSTASQSNVPVHVVGVGGTGLLSGIADITAGMHHTCALSATGGVYCWGNNGNGQLGNNSTTSSNVPVQVVGVGGSGLLSGIASIAGSYYHTCALSATGGVYCWGNNGNGQLGNNSTARSYVPVQVVGVGGTGLLSGIADITAGMCDNTCAVTTTGGVYCWGYNGDGELGNNSTAQSNVPVQVVGVGGAGLLSGIATIAAGVNTCAVTTTGAVYCWGYNNYGEIGNNSTTSSNVPVQVVGVGGTGLLSGIASIAVGYYHTCALSATGRIDCWGYNGAGQLGNNSTTNSHVPVEVTGF
jgi:alpha-tubulin suppressor-like RCC1 family protein